MSRQPPALHAGRAEIHFEWAGDRWRHRVTIDGVPVAESVEGVTPAHVDPRWPASPVIVETHLTAVAKRVAIVGVGIAGRSHFSASIVPHPHLSDTLLFELACRIQEQPLWLGSTYRSDTEAGKIVAIRANGAGPAGNLPRTVEWSYTIGPAGIGPVGGTGGHGPGEG